MTTDALRHSSTALPKAPACLVDDGAFNLGVYGSAFREVNFVEARVARGAGGGMLGGRRLIEFQHFALGNGRFHVSVALFDTKAVGQAQVSIYDRETKTKYRHERKAMPWELTLPETVWDGAARFQRGQFKIHFENGLSRGAHTLHFHCPATGTLPAVEGQFTCYENGDSSPVVVCLPFEGGAAMYSHKGILPAEGELRIGGERFTFPRACSYAMTDFHKGYYPRPLRWNWCAGAGFDAQGRLMGFNITCNQVTQPEIYNENWVFVEGLGAERLPLSEFRIEDSSALGKAWRVQDVEGRVDLEFTPEISHSIDMNLGLLASRYRGPYGSFYGHVLTEHGEAIDLGTCFGMAEDIWLRA